MYIVEKIWDNIQHDFKYKVIKKWMFGSDFIGLFDTEAKARFVANELEIGNKK